MPSPISHIAAGIIIYRSLPEKKRQKYRIKIFHYPLLAIIILGVSLLPDMDAVIGILTGDMGSYHNQATHSIFTGIAVAIILGAVMRWWLKGSYLFWAGLLFASYATHLLMDMLTHGRGIMLLWPLTDQRFLSPILLFYGLRWSHGVWSLTHIWTVVSELAFWGIVFWLARRLHVGRKTSDN